MRYLVLFVCLASSQSLYKGKWQNFKVMGAMADSVTLISMLNQIRSFNEEFEHFFDSHIEGDVLIQLAQSESEYIDLTGGAVPDWSGAVAYRKEQKIIVKPGSPYSVFGNLETLKHEIVHLYLKGKYIPLWLEEGLAMNLSGKTITWWDHIRIGNSVAGGNIIPFSEIDKLLSFGYNKAYLAYLQSLVAVQYIAEMYGSQGIRDLTGAAETRQTVESLFQTVLKIDFELFEIRYRKYLEKKYRYMFILQFEYLLLILMVLLVALAYLRMRIRNRRILDGWEE
jgi:hypothetical protein